MADKKKRLVPLEEDEQRLLFDWATVSIGAHPELALLFAIPNGGYRSKATAARMKATGEKAGVPDMFLPVPRCGSHGLWIELKRRYKDLTHISSNQKLWVESLRQQGYMVYVCYGWEEARHTILDYLRGVL